MLIFLTLAIFMLGLAIAILLADWVYDPIPKSIKPQIKNWGNGSYLLLKNGGYTVVDGTLLDAVEAAGNRVTAIEYTKDGARLVAGDFIIKRIKRHSFVGGKEVFA